MIACAVVTSSEPQTANASVINTLLVIDIVNKNKVRADDNLVCKGFP